MFFSASVWRPGGGNGIRQRLEHLIIRIPKPSIRLARDLHCEIILALEEIELLLRESCQVRRDVVCVLVRHDTDGQRSLCLPGDGCCRGFTGAGDFNTVDC